LEDTLRHKQRRYVDQKRITTKAGETNSEIAERIAAAAVESGAGDGAGTAANSARGLGTSAEREKTTLNGRLGTAASGNFA
jgi:hypothetical protein